MACASVAASTLVVAGAKLSERRFLAAVFKQAQELTAAANEDLLLKTGAALKSGRGVDLNSVAETLLFLQGQRRDIPEVAIIYAADSDRAAPKEQAARAATGFAAPVLRDDALAPKATAVGSAKPADVAG